MKMIKNIKLLLFFADKSFVGTWLLPSGGR